MAKKVKHPEHVNHERWLVSYADFITLLFATFTALYALSKADADKTKAVAESLRISFGTESNSLIAMTAVDMKGIPSDKQGSKPTGKGSAKKQATPSDMENVKGQVETMLMSRKLLNAVQVDITTRGLVISLKESGFFESGKSEMKWDAYPVLGEIAASLEEFRNPIRVEGHTDTVPMHTRTFPSNWELSSGRATEVVRLLSGRFGLPPQRLSAVGYAEFKPVFSNATPAGRARNRRVDLVVLNSESEIAEAPAETKEEQSRHGGEGVAPTSDSGHEKGSETGQENAESGHGSHEGQSGDAHAGDAHLAPSESAPSEHPAVKGPNYHPALDDWSGSP